MIKTHQNEWLWDNKKPVKMVECFHIWCTCLISHQERKQVFLVMPLSVSLQRAFLWTTLWAHTAEHTGPLPMAPQAWQKD
jgi:hypothetical protein